MSKICVLASGGDAPGMNAAFEGFYEYGTRTGVDVWAVRDGFDGLVNGDFVRLTSDNATDIGDKAGCVFLCSRSKAYMTSKGFARAVENVKRNKFDCVVVIGGNGSLLGAGHLKMAGVNALFIPATIDNDVPNMKYSLGFSSAAENAVNCIDAINATMHTNGRDHVVVLMGRACDELAIRVGISTCADIIDIGSNRHTPAQVAKIFADNRKNGKTSNFMIMREESSDFIKQAEISSKFIQELIAVSGDPGIRISTLGYLQRGAKPTSFDRFLGSSYARAVIECVKSKTFGVSVTYVNEAVSIINLEPVKLPDA